jgi:L-asparaginase
VSGVARAGGVIVRGARRSRWLAALAVAAFALASSPAAAQKPRIHVIATGGTISNLGNDQRRTGDELVQAIPRLGEMARLTVEQFSNVASGSITVAMWRQLAGRIRELQDGPDAPAGFVITHGTDTMEETAYFLSLTVGGCTPVVLTGAMRQASAVGADGPANLLNAVRVAAAPVSRGRGTMLLMHDEIFAARDVTKSNTTRLDAFSAPFAGDLGIADPDTIVFTRGAADTTASCRPPLFDLRAMGDLPRVDVAYAYIDADSVAVDAFVAAGAKGIVMAGVGRGGSTPGLGRALRRATTQGVMVAVSNRTGSGRVGADDSPDELAALPPGRGAFIGADDLNPQKARVLLMLALGAHLDPAGIQTLFTAR